MELLDVNFWEAVFKVVNWTGSTPILRTPDLRLIMGLGGVSWEHDGSFQPSTSVKRWQCWTPRGVTVSQIAAELGIGANILGRWRRELRQTSKQAFVGNGRSRDEEVSQLRRELARVTKERDFLREAAAFFARAST